VIALPDTALVREALVAARSALPAPILDHSLRTYLLAAAYADAVGRAHDEEGLCLAAIFHDVGLVARDARVPFTYASSRALARFLEGRVPRAHVAPLTDAILFHMQLLPRWSKGEVAGLLQIGAWMDATGLRRGRIAARAAEIEARLPRGAFDREFKRRLLASMKRPSACFGLLFPAKEVA
jgi:hypothetical protein